MKRFMKSGGFRVSSVRGVKSKDPKSNDFVEITFEQNTCVDQGLFLATGCFVPRMPCRVQDKPDEMMKPLCKVWYKQSHSTSMLQENAVAILTGTAEQSELVVQGLVQS